MMHLTMSLLLQTAVVAGGQDYATAYHQTRETGRPLVVLVGADWCPGCVTMKNASMPEVEKRGGLEQVEYAYVNTDEQSRLASQLMQGSSIPQLILYHKTANGWKRERLVGARAPAEIEAFIERAIETETVREDVPQISSRPRSTGEGSGGQ